MPVLRRTLLLRGRRSVLRPCCLCHLLTRSGGAIRVVLSAWGNKKEIPGEVLDWVGPDFGSSNGMVKRLYGVGIIGDDERRLHEAFTDQFVGERMEIGPEHLEREMETI